MIILETKLITKIYSQLKNSEIVHVKEKERNNCTYHVICVYSLVGNLKLISKVAPRNTSKSDYYQTLSTRSAIVITLTNEKKHNNLLSESLQ
ncbi:unnamed protein product [Schistosoma bovis]|nr:unnamed protein product [Schistosoma bovis]